MINSVLIDKRNYLDILPILKKEMGSCLLWGLDCETQDEDRHEGLNIYNNAKRHVFDHRRTVMTGFSIYCQYSDTAYYVNLAHADEENRLPLEVALEILSYANPDAVCVAHNAPFEIVMFRSCLGVELKNLVCTLQMAVSHHSPDEYELATFYKTPLPFQFVKNFAGPISTAYSNWEPGMNLNDDQQELLSKFIAKESKAEHSWNGFVKSIAKGYNLKALTWSRFGVKQMTYEQVLKDAGAKHMGQLTGEQVCSYGADDAYWAVRHYEWMLEDMLANNPRALMAFFETENKMVQEYADAWYEGIRLDLPQVFERRDVERHEMAETLRAFKAKVHAALPFPEKPHAKLMEREKWYAKHWQKKRKQIIDWANSPDSDDDFTQAYQVSNPIGNAWALEKGKSNPGGKLNLVHFHGMRTIMYDLIDAPMQYADGSVASDKEARGRIREKLEKQGRTEALAIMVDLQTMSEIEQRMKLYLTPYTQLMDPETSRVYPSLSSILATRRLAMSFPNAMQLAKSGSSAYIRGFYLGDTDDDVVISADWSSIELVLIGDQSGDEGFREVFGQLPYGDMHSGAAVDALSIKTLPGLTEAEFKEFKFGRNPNNRILRNFAGVDLSPSDYHKFMRGTPVGKGINFGYWYSGALSTVANNLGLTDSEHWELVEMYRNRFPRAEHWRVNTQDQAALYGYVTLPDGHRRTKFEATKDWGEAMRQKFAQVSADPGWLRYGDLAIKRLTARAKNQVVNSLIQGTCATLAKRSILRLLELCDEAGIPVRLQKKSDMYGGRLMMPIHDELVFSVKRWHVMEFIKLLRKAMTEHPDIVKTLPLDCTVAIGRTFRPFNKADPKLTQIELDEAQFIDGVIPKELEGTKLSDDKVEDLLEYIFS